MRLINNIKFNYKLNLIEDNFNSNNYNEIKKILLSSQNTNSSFYYDLIKSIDKYLKNLDHDGFFNKKIIWLISFDLEDLNLLKNFINFYLSKTTKSSFKIKYYGDELASTINKIYQNEISDEINFDHLTKISSLLQNLILLNNYNNYDLIFIEMNSAFFETYDKNYLIYPHTTQCYIYLTQSPYTLFKRKLSKYQKSEAALEEICNFSNKLIMNNYKSKNELRFYENRQSWNVNVNSWIDNNVQDTFRGSILNSETLESNLEETLINVLYHLIQSGINLEVDYDLIDEFVSSSFVAKQGQLEFSNKEKKLLSRNLDQKLLDKFNFQI